MQEELKKYHTQSYILIAFIVFMLITRIRLIFSYSIDLDGVEFMFIHYIQNILFHKGMYSDIYKYPFDTVIHMPLYTYIMAGILKLFHLTTVNDIHAQLIVCRLLSVLCLPVTVFYMLKILKQFNKDNFVSLCVICFFMLLLTGHFFSARQDALKTTFYLMFLYYSLGYLNKIKSLRFFVFASISLYLAINMKQDIIVYVFLYLLTVLFIYRNGRSLLLIFVFFLCISVTYILGFTFFNKKFLDNTILLNFQIGTTYLTSYNFVAMLFSIARTSPVLLFLIYLHKKNIEILKEKKDLYVLVYLSYVTYGIAHLLILRGSSYINYTHESIAVILITIGSLLSYYTISEKFLKRMTITSSVLLLSSIIIHAYPLSGRHEIEYKKKYTQNLQNRKIINSIIKDSTVFFTTGDNTIFYPDKKIVYGYDYHIDQFIYAYLGFTTHTKLVFLKTDLYDSYIADGNIKFIIANDNERDKEIMNKNFGNYIFYKKVHNLLVYKYP